MGGTATAGIAGAPTLAAGFGGSFAAPVVWAGGTGVAAVVDGCAVTGFGAVADGGAKLPGLVCPDVLTGGVGKGDAGDTVAGCAPTGFGAPAAGFPAPVCAGAPIAAPVGDCPMVFVPGCPEAGCGLATAGFGGGGAGFGSSPPINNDIACP